MLWLLSPWASTHMLTQLLTPSALCVPGIVLCPENREWTLAGGTSWSGLAIASPYLLSLASLSSELEGCFVSLPPFIIVYLKSSWKAKA